MPNFPFYVGAEQKYNGNKAAIHKCNQNIENLNEKTMLYQRFLNEQSRILALLQPITNKAASLLPPPGEVTRWLAHNVINRREELSTRTYCQKQCLAIIKNSKKIKKLYSHDIQRLFESGVIRIEPVDQQNIIVTPDEITWKENRYVITPKAVLEKITMTVSYLFKEHALRVNTQPELIPIPGVSPATTNRGNKELLLGRVLPMTRDVLPGVSSYDIMPDDAIRQIMRRNERVRNNGPLSRAERVRRANEARERGEPTIRQHFAQGVTAHRDDFTDALAHTLRQNAHNVHNVQNIPQPAWDAPAEVTAIPVGEMERFNEYLQQDVRMPQMIAQQAERARGILMPAEPAARIRTPAEWATILTGVQDNNLPTPRPERPEIGIALDEEQVREPTIEYTTREAIRDNIAALDLATLEERAIGHITRVHNENVFWTPTPPPVIRINAGDMEAGIRNDIPIPPNGTGNRPLPPYDELPNYTDDTTPFRRTPNQPPGQG